MLTKQHLCSLCFEKILPCWHSMPNTFPEFLQPVSEAQKNKNEALLDEHHELAAVDNMLHIKKHISRKLFHDFKEKTQCLTDRIKAFDENLTMEDIHQALRNYFIYAIITDLQAKPQNCRDTIFAYSLLYPYTDNFIDEAGADKLQKEAYNRLIRNTLSGEKAAVSTFYEKKTQELLLLILDSYPSADKRHEAASVLLLMLEAQELSMKQHYKLFTKKLSKEDVLHISAYKGGISVLLDYLFSIDFEKSSVTESEIIFYLSFGLILQLADDLQDIKEDRKKHSQTLMSIQRRKKNLERVVNRLLHFIHSTLGSYEPPNPKLRDFMLQNCFLMILAAVAVNEKRFSKKYLKRVEAYLPFHMAYIRKKAASQPM